MHFLMAALATVLATGAAAFTLPADLESGIYHSYYDKDGHEVHELVQAVNATTLRRGTTDSEGLSLAKRLPGTPLLEYSCGCGFDLDPPNCDAAVQGLKNYVDDHETTETGCYLLTLYTATWSYVNDVVAFLCNPGTGDGDPAEYGVCSSDLTNSFAAITSHCGLYIAGTEAAAAWIPSPDGSVIIDDYYFTGYMQYTAGLDFCGNDWDEGDNEHC